MARFILQTVSMGQTELVKGVVKCMCTLKHGEVGKKRKKKKCHKCLLLIALGFRNTQCIQDCSQAVGHS